MVEVNRSPRIILAPMQGLTELLFRKTYEQCFGGAIDAAVSPFLSLTHGNLADAWKKIDDVWPERNKGSIPVVPQILGKEIEEFVELANRLYEVGYTEVNWNIGCPMRRVAHKHRGSGILPYPDEVQQILDNIVPRLKPQLSIKMRLGYNSNTEIDALIPILNRFPLKSVTIHPRIGKQIYTGTVDLAKLDEVAPQLKHPLIYNGDITTAEECDTVMRRYPMVKEVMIGRGVLYDPTLPMKIKRQPIPQHGMQTFVTALMDAIEARPVSDQAKWRKTKEYWCLLCHSMEVTEEEKREVLHAPTLSETRQLIEKILEHI